MKKLTFFLLLVAGIATAQTTKIFCPTHSVTMGDYQYRVPVYYSVKHVPTNTVVYELFDTEGGLYVQNIRQNNHPNPNIIIPTGEYQIKMCNLAKNKMEVRFEAYNIQEPTKFFERQLKAGECYTLTYNMIDVSSNPFWTYKINCNAFFNDINGVKSTSPPFPASTLGDITVGTRKNCSDSNTVEFVPTAGQTITAGHSWAILPNTLQIAGINNIFAIF